MFIRSFVKRLVIFTLILTMLIPSTATEVFAATTKYKITYYGNGGANVPGAQTKTKGRTLYLSSKIPSRTGYNFKGWGTSSTAKYPSYYPGGKYTRDASASLYAVWSKKTYTISYNANKGKGAPNSQTKTYGMPLTLSGTKPTRSGYIFLGWSQYSNATKEQYKSNGRFTKDANTTLYAVWRQAESYAIRYSANGGSGVPSDQIKIEGITLTLRSYKPTRVGHTFLGWSTNVKASSPMYLAGGKYYANAPARLYAIWKRNTYTIKYSANGGKGGPTSQTKQYGINITLSKSKPTRTGHTFKGWGTSSTAKAPSYSSGAQYTKNGSVTLHAIWQKHTYSIKYNANNGSGAPSPQTKTYGQTLTLSSIKPVRQGYIFTGWSATANGKPIYSAGGKYNENKGNTLYATWRKPNTYSIKYNANGGKGAPSTQTKKETIALTLSKVQPTRDGYIFKGWATSSKSSTVVYKPGAIYKANQSATLYAVWAKKTYTVKYSANGGGGAPSSQTKKHGETLTLRGGKPTRRGYIFSGWATSATSSTVSYKANGTYKGNAGITLYAVWKAQGGTWIPNAGYPTHSHIYKKVYMPKDIATEYYMVLSDQTTFEWIADQAADLGIPAAAGIIAKKLGISSKAAAAAATTAMLLMKYTKFMNERNLKDTINSCPKNGFVVIEYWLLKNLMTGQMSPAIIHENATNVSSGGSFQAGVYYTN